MLVDDNQRLLEVLAYVVEGEADLQLVATAVDADTAVARGVRTEPHVVVMDHALPGRDGAHATSELCHRLPDVRVIMLSASCSRRLIQGAFAAGACGYLVKGDSPHLLVEAIRCAAQGGSPLAPLARELLARPPQGSPKPRDAS